MTAATSAQPARPCAKMIAPIRKNGRGRGNPLISTRRNAAAPTLFEHVAFSFGGIRNHGTIAPSFFMGVLHPQILTGGREGGSRACRFLVRGISTPHGLPSPWKVRAVLQFAQGASVMMRTLSRSVSTAFPSIPEPIFLPVQSCRKHVEERPQVNTFTDVADSAEGLLQRAQAGGLMGSESIASAVSCAIARCRAILSVLVRKSGRGRGNPLISNRRTIAGPRLMRGFSFGGSSNHGVIASAFLGALYPQFLTGSRAGGFRACRHLLRGISTPHGLPSPWKGRAVPNLATGISAMMRTLSRNVSTAFPSIPEPTFLPVQSCHKRVEERPQVNTFTDVADGLERLLERCTERAAFIESAPADCRHKQAARNALRGYLSDLLDLCADVQAIAETAGRPAHAYTVEARA